MLPERLFLEKYRSDEHNEKPRYGSFDYNTGTRTTCFCFSNKDILECWSRAIAARALGRNTVTLNLNKNGSNVIISSDKSVFVIYDTHNDKLASWIKSTADSPSSLFKLVYDDLPDKAKKRLTRLGYTGLQDNTG